MNKIRYFRCKQGLPLKALVQATNISMGHLSRLENGKKEPSKAAMEAIARALGLTVPDIFYPDTAGDTGAPKTKEGANHATSI